MTEALRDAGYGSNRGTDRVALLGRWAPVRTGPGRLTVFGGVHAARFGEPGTVPLAWQREGRVGFFDSLQPETTSTSARAFAAVRFVVGDGGGGVTSALAHGQVRRLRLDENFTGFLLDPERGDRLGQRHDVAGGGLRLAHERALTGQLQLRSGLDLSGERLDQHEDRLDGGGRPFARNRQLQGHQATAGAHVGAVWMRGSWLRLEGGLRAQAFRFDVAGQSAATEERRDADSLTFAWLPRVQALLQPSARVGLLLAYGRGVRPPEARAVLHRPAATGDRDLSSYRGGSPRPTLSDDLEAGVRFRPADGPRPRGGRVCGLHRARADLRPPGRHEPGAQRHPTAGGGGRRHRASSPLADPARGRHGGGRALFGVGPSGAGGAHPVRCAGGARRAPLGAVGRRPLRFAVAPRPLAHGARAGALSTLDALLLYRRGHWEVSLQVDNLLDTRLREGEFNYASWFDRNESRSLVPRVHYAAGPPRTIRAGLGARF